MNKLIAIITVCMISAFTTEHKKKKIVFFGDSITQAGVDSGGYINRMNQTIKKNGKAENYELVGAGVSGNKIYDLYLRVEDDVLAKKPDVVVVWIGVNDVWHKQTTGTGTDAEKFVKFYNALIKKFKSNNIDVYLCTPGVIGEKTDFSNELDGDLNKYSSIIRTIAKDNNCKLIDLRKGFLEYNIQNNIENKEQGILTSDGVHLNEKGNIFVAEQMMKALL